MRLSAITATAIFAVVSASAAAHADTLYTYTGQNFDVVFGTYTTSDRVTGSFTFNAPLAANLSYNTDLIPLTFSLSDGMQTINLSNALLYGFSVVTDSKGIIQQWGIYASAAGGAFINIESLDDGEPFQDIGYSPFAVGVGEASKKGTFAETTTSVTPEPSSMVLLGTGLFGVVGVLRYRFAQRLS